MANSKEQQIKESTRKIYEAQHNYVRQDEVAMKRFINMYSEEYFLMGGIDKNFLRSSKILEIGCGNTGKTAIGISIISNSVLDYTFSDLGSDWIDPVKESLGKYSFDWSKSTFIAASADDLPFDDGSFDFAICHGVLLHLPSIESAERAVSEICRVTKPTGKIYGVGGVVGGIYESALFPAARSFYQTNSDFKYFIDNISAKNVAALTEQFSSAIATLGIKDSPLEKLIQSGKFSHLFDTDLFVTLQNIIQAPVRLQLGEEWWASNFGKGGFTTKSKLSRRVARENIRSIFQDLHYINAISKSQGSTIVPQELSNFLDAIYGSGNLEFIFSC